MSITKIQSESLNLSDTYDFTGTVTGAGESNTPSFSAKQSGSQTITSDTDTLLNFATEIFDTDGAYDGTNKFTVPTGQGGKYFFNANLAMDSMYNENIIIGTLAKNGTNDQTIRTRVIMAKDNASISFNICGIVEADAGDYFQIKLYHNQGSNRTTNETRSSFRGFKISS